MKELNKYILEKFKISKDIKDEVNTDTIVSCITAICRISLEWPEHKKIVDEIEKWCKDNNLEELEDIEIFAPLSLIKGTGSYNRLKEEGWLDKIKDVPSFTPKLSSNYINTLTKDAKLVAEYTKNDKYGKLYRYDNDYRYGDAIIFVKEITKMYYWFKKK